MKEPADRDLYFDISQIRVGAIQSVGRNSNIVVAMALLKMVLHLGSTVILARLIPPEEFGVVAVALPVVTVGLALSEFGLSQAVVQAPRIGHRVVSMLFWINIAFSLAVAAVFALVAGRAAVFFDEPRVTDIFYFFALSVFLNGSVSQYNAILNRRLEVFRLEYVNLFAFVTSTAIAIAAAYGGAGYWAIVLQQVLGAVLTAGLLVLIVPWRPSLPSRDGWAGAKQHLGFGANLTVSNLVQTLGKALPVVFVGRGHSPVDAGLFQRGTALSDLLPLRIARPLTGVYVSTLSKYQEDPGSFRKVFERAVARINMLLIPFGLILFTCSDVIVPAVFGAEWRDLAPVLAWLSLLMLQVGAERGLYWSLIASGMGRVLLVYGGFGLVIMVAVLILRIDRDIPVLAAWIVLSQIFVSLPLLAGLALRYTPLDLATVLRPVLIDGAGAVAAIFAIRAVRPAVAAHGPTVELLAAMGVVCAVVLLRVLATPSLRAVPLRLLVRLVRLFRRTPR